MPFGSRVATGREEIIKGNVSFDEVISGGCCRTHVRQMSKPMNRARCNY
jgi:hypothetical protein